MHSVSFMLYCCWHKLSDMKVADSARTFTGPVLCSKAPQGDSPISQ